MGDLSPIDFTRIVVSLPAGDIPGGSPLHRIAYFLNERAEAQVGFAPHWDGPFSSILDYALELLLSDGEIEQEVRSNAGERSAISTHVLYRLTEEGRRRTEALRGKHKDLFEYGERVAQILFENGNGMSPVLRLAAQLHQAHGHETYGALGRAIEGLRRRVDPELVASAAGVLAQLELGDARD